MRLERSAYLLLFYCDQDDLPIFLSISSVVVLVTSEAFKGQQIKVASHANRKVVSPHITPIDVWLSLFSDICAIIKMGYNNTQKRAFTEQGH